MTIDAPQDPRRSLMRSWPRVLAGVFVVFVALIAAGLWWATRPATWPPELDPPLTDELFSDPQQLTQADLVLLDQMVTKIALEDPVVAELLGDMPWPEPEIGPAYFYAEGRSALTGGAFSLTLNNRSYAGAWPTAGCSSGRYRGTVTTIVAEGLTDVSVTVDLTFGRVTRLVIPPQAIGPATGTAAPSMPSGPKYEFGDDLDDAPWYSGRCPLLRAPN